MSAKWAIELIGKQHQRDVFDCGEESLNNYLRRFARQNTGLGVSRTYVATEPPSLRVAGYYSIATGSVKFEELPPNARKKLPQYPVPTAHVARLAVDRPRQGEGLGAVLLFNALRRAAGVAEQIGVYAVTVDALHDRAKAFYLKYGFEPMATHDLRLYILLDTVRKALP